MILAAGHAFNHSPGTGFVCDCGRRWNDIRGLGKAEVGQDRIAHVGSLTKYEAQSIEDARAKEDARIDAATMSVCA